MKWILRLYPPAWQRRYRRELAAHLAAEPSFRLRTALDLLAGAVDAWLNPGSIPTPTDTGDDHDMVTASRCEPLDIPKADALHSGVWMIVVTFVLTASGVALDRTFGDHILIEALLNSSFFIALTISSQKTFLRPYSRTARTVLTAAGVVGWYAFFVGVSALAAMT